MLLFTRTTGERCSLPKYSIHNVLTVLVKPVITFNALSHLFRSCCFLHEQYTFTFSSLTISSDPILMLRSPHPGNSIIFPRSNDFKRWARISFWSHRVELGDSPWHKEVAVAIAKRAQSQSPYCSWLLMTRIVKYGVGNGGNSLFAWWCFGIH